MQYTLIFASVLMLVALGGCFSEHSGVINLGLEGIMVMGALGGALAMKYMGADASAPAIIFGTTLAAIACGVVFSLLLAFACVNFNADQTLVGTAMNLLATAFATIIARAINTAEDPNNVSNTIQYIQQKKALIVNINGFEFSWFMLFALVALILAYIILYKTRFGLRLIACGENPQAADSVGINVYKMRWAGVLRLRLPVSGSHDLRPVETSAHCSGCSDVRVLPRIIQCLFRHCLPECTEHRFQDL